ncbi:hypothetical protein GQ44DRAFT_744502 [Phaeosphaeriaceae sp. PMI808]|nr:hypothetical protein GQ44DRAFT_744502 [Phaeosphaeriaceae sp. PMI808]
MVDISEVRKGNARFAAQAHSGLVCVFAGAAARIGSATLREMVGFLRSSTFYVLGRDPSRYQNRLDELKTIENTNKIIFIETQVALISSIDDAYKQIQAAEKKVDIICLSPGGMSFQGAICKEQDIGPEKSWGIIAVVNHTTVCTSLAFDYLAANDSLKHVTFLHATPGFVQTETPRTTYPPKSNGLVRWALISFFQIVSGWIIRYFGKPVKESGERHAYALTNDKFVSGSWRISHLSEVVPDNDVLVGYQERGLGEWIWGLTNCVWNQAVAKDVNSEMDPRCARTEIVAEVQ